MINMLTVDQALRDLIGHDCENDHADATPYVDQILGEIQSPADVGMVTIMAAYLSATFLEARLDQKPAFWSVTLSDDIEHDNLPIVVAYRLVACAANHDFQTVIAIAHAESLDPEHAREVLDQLLIFAHDA